jgi:hypothetical protein
LGIRKRGGIGKDELGRQTEPFGVPQLEVVEIVV